MPAMPAPQMTTSAVGALNRSQPLVDAWVEHVAQPVAEHVDGEHGGTRPASLSTLPDRLDRQLARRAKRDRVDAVLAEPGRDRLAVQGPHPAPPGLLGIVGQLPETRPELALERRRRPLRAVALRDLSLPVQHGSVGGPAAVGEDPAEEQQGLALERVAGGHEVVLELDDERVDVDLVTVERELPRLADRVALGIELGDEVN